MVIVPGICGAFGGGVVVSAVESECEHSVSDERRASPMQRESVVVSTGLLLPRNEAGNGGGDGGGGDTLRSAHAGRQAWPAHAASMASGSIESESQLECCEEDEPRKLPLQFGCDSGGGGGGGDSEEADDAIASRTIAQ